MFYNMLMDNNMPQNTNSVGSPFISPAPPTAPAPMPYTAPTPKKSKKPLIIAGVAVILLLIGVSVTVSLLLSNKSSEEKDDTVLTTARFEDMTKEQAFAFFKKYYGKNYMPKGLVDEKMKLKDGLKAYNLLLSYENEADIPKIANESTMNLYRDETYPLEQRFNVEKASDLYSIVTATDKIPADTDEIRYLGICFNKEYVDYRDVEETDSDGSVSVDRSLTLKKIDKETAEKVLKIYATTEIYGRTIHSYALEESDNAYKIKVNLIGVGVTSLSASADHTLNTYYMAWSIDKKTGDLDAVFVRPADYSRNFVINSYKLSDDEYNELFKIMSNTSAY